MTLAIPAVRQGQTELNFVPVADVLGNKVLAHGREITRGPS